MKIVKNKHRFYSKMISTPQNNLIYNTQEKCFTGKFVIPNALEYGVFGENEETSFLSDKRNTSQLLGYP
ncbi:hypothetical protein [Candidatus Lokiarchaeum ossiferum]|uniref:hypothetical protein n=1 Tax=Candidatus Lokiarchaeum ossiferum TaxID=2951803 RepID=UPI00352E184B